MGQERCGRHPIYYGIFSVTNKGKKDCVGLFVQRLKNGKSTTDFLTFY
jgi:hypothetical protein